MAPMSFADRDYRRTDPRDFASWRWTSVTAWLIGLNVAVFIADYVLMGMGIGYLRDLGNGYAQRVFFLEQWGHFSAALAIGHFQFWRFLSFQFLHASIGHLLFNMLALYFFGQMVEHYLGARRYLVFYLLCGISGALAYMGLWGLGILVASPWVHLVGASAGIFGVLIAAAYIAPDAQVMLLFPPIPLPLKTVAYVMLAIAVYTVFSNGRNAGGEAAHLGGAALGAYLIRRPALLKALLPPGKND